MANFKVWAEKSENLADIVNQESEQTDGVLRVGQFDIVLFNKKILYKR